MGEKMGDYQKPKISVIVPVYNCEKYVGVCLDSILDNVYQNLEVIVVNDGSTDGSADAIKEYYNPKTSKFDKRIIYVEQKNKGLSGARNTGLKQATGEWISFVDADDILHCLFYDRLIDAVTNPYIADADIVECKLHKFKDKDERKLYDGESFAWSLPIMKRTSAENIVSKVKHVENYPYDGVIQMNKLYRKKIFEYVQYPEGLYHEDEYVIYEEMKHSRKVIYLDGDMYGYRVGREGSITNTVKPKNLEDMVKSRGHVIEEVVKDSSNMELSKADANDWIKLELTRMLNDLMYMCPKVEKTDEVKKAILQAKELYKKYDYVLEKKLKYELFFKAPKLMECYVKKKGAKR